MKPRPPLSSLSVDRLRDRANEMRAMALTARTLRTTEALVRLAERFEKMAAERQTNVSEQSAPTA